MNAQILKRIEEMQRGKQGIYPYHVATQIAVEFQIPMPEAIDHVSAHIRAVMDADAEHAADAQAKSMAEGFAEALALTRKATQ